MKKKILAIAMAVAMMASMGSLAFAADTDQTINKGGTIDSTTVSLTVDPSYTVKIPSNVTLSASGATTLNFSAENVVIGEGEHINISVASGLTAGKLSLSVAGKSTSLDATAKLGEADYTDNSTVIAAFDKDTLAPASSFTLTPATPVYAGNYTGTITFQIAVA